MLKNWWEQFIRAGAFIALGYILYLFSPNIIISICFFSLSLLSIQPIYVYLYAEQVYQFIEENRKQWELIWIWLTMYLTYS